MKIRKFFSDRKPMTAFSERLKNAKEFFTNLLTETSPFDRLSEHANNSQDVVKLLPMLDLKDKTSGRISKFPRPAGGNLKGFSRRIRGVCVENASNFIRIMTNK